jgi:hypothetical protein
MSDVFANLDEDQSAPAPIKKKYTDEALHNALDAENEITEPVGEVSEINFLPHEHLYKAGKQKMLASRAIIIWFRLRCPGWTIKTELISRNDIQMPSPIENAKYKDATTFKEAVAKATIYDKEGRERASDYKRWTTDKNAGEFFIECACTGAQNRAILCLGFSALNAMTDFHPDGFDDTRKPFEWNK